LLPHPNVRLLTQCGNICGMGCKHQAEYSCEYQALLSCSLSQLVFVEQRIPRGVASFARIIFCSPLHRIHLRVTSKMLSAPCQAPLVKPAGADCGYVPRAVTFKVKDLGCHLGVTASADLPTAACLSTSCKVSLAENIWIRVRVRPDNQVFWKPKKL
jgi:hypothetical protein